MESTNKHLQSFLSKQRCGTYYPVNKSRIFKDPLVKACLCTDIKFDDPTAVFSFINTIRSKIFNLNKFIHNLDFKAFL